MVGKIMKHELHALFRKLVILYAIVIAFAVLLRVVAAVNVPASDGDTYFGLLAVLSVFYSYSLIAACVAATVLGICGGYQILGQDVNDPNGVEGHITRLPGLGLLPVSTTIEGEKVTRQVHFSFLSTEAACQGYEIHMGQTRMTDSSAVALNTLADGASEGCYANARCMGTYIHGILDNPCVIDALLAPYADRTEHLETTDYASFKNEQYDKLAAHVRAHLDMERLYQILQNS